MRLRNWLERYSGFAARALEANVRDLSLPYRLFLHVTDACNCRCNMCSIWQKPTDGELSTSEIQAVLRHSSSHIRWMDMTGGEIFLRDDILELFQTVAQEMPRLLLFHFATNGMLTHRIVEAVRILKRSAIPQVIATISLDGPEEVHTRIRGIPGIWPKCMETFRRLRALNVPVVFGMTLTEHNHDQYDALFEAARREVPGLEHDDIHVNLAQISDLYYGNRGLIQPPGEALLRSIQAIQTHRSHSLDPVNVLERTFQRHAATFLKTGKTPVPCEALSSSVVLGPRGDLYPCIIFDRSIGNVRDAGYAISRVWEKDARATLRAEIREGQCPHCWTPCEAYQSILANVLPFNKNSLLSTGKGSSQSEVPPDASSPVVAADSSNGPFTGGENGFPS